jgi:hypothetical protein
VQGRLRGTPLTVTIQTECRHCAEPIQILLNHELEVRNVEGPSDPLVFMPFVDFASLKDPDIIDSF